jgi:hypothetical protein
MQKEQAIEEAMRMLDAFASVGVKKFDITHLDLDANKRGFRPSQSLQQIRTSMPYLVESAAMRRNNVIVRPHQPASAQLVQLDDLEQGALKRVRDLAFLVLCTSPGNHQAWVAIGEFNDELPRRLRKGAGADLTASGATRVAGTANFKRKYEPDFPIVTILAVQPGRTVTVSYLEELGLLAPADPIKEAPASPLRVSRRGSGKRVWPDYGRVLERAPLAHNSDQRDVSRADFAWCLIAADWKFGVEEVAARLMEESSKARENGEQYALATAQRAAQAAQRRERKR